MVTSRMDIHSICKAAAFLKDDDVFSRPLHVWSTENRHREHSQRLSGQAAVMISLSVPSLLGVYREGPSGRRSCWSLQTYCLAWHHLAKSHRLNQKYASVNFLANRGHVLFPGFSFLFPDVSLVTHGAQRELLWKPKTLIFHQPCLVCPTV